MNASLQWKLLCLYRQMETTAALLEVMRELGAGRLSLDVQQYFLEGVSKDKIVSKYPPDIAYTARLLKLVILAAEKEALAGDRQSGDDEDCVLEAVYLEHMKYMEAVSSVGTADSLQSEWCYRTYAYQVPVSCKSLKGENLESSQRASEDNESKASMTVSDSQQHEQEEQGQEEALRTRDGEASTSQTWSDGDEGSEKRLTQLVTVRVSLNVFEGGTGCTTWTAGFYLAEFALTKPEIFARKRCLELGSGTGVLGVVLARLGVTELRLTDGNEETLENLRQNLKLNEVEVRNNSRKQGPSDLTSCWKNGEALAVDEISSQSNGCDGPIVRCEYLDWENVSEAQLRAFDVDVILAADVLYDPDVIPDLVRIFRTKLRKTNALHETPAFDERVPEACERVAFIATALRNEKTLDAFLDAVKAHGLRIELVDPHERTDCFQYCNWMNRERIRLHRITCR